MLQMFNPKGSHVAQTQRRGALCARDGGGDGESGGSGTQCRSEGVFNCISGDFLGILYCC